MAVDRTSKLKVRVDGEAAVRDLTRLRAGFWLLTQAVDKARLSMNRFNSQASGFSRLVGSGLSRMLGSMSSGFQRMAPFVRGLSDKLGTLGKSFTMVGRVAGGAFSILQSGFNMFTRVFTMAFSVVKHAIFAFVAWSAAVVDAGIKTDKFVNTLVVLTGSTSRAVEELNWLFELSNKLGTSFVSSAAPFTKFAAAASGSLNTDEIRDVFTTFQEIGVALQLTRAETVGVFLALQQIASKGIVSMEELRLQLAERIPGAMKFAAASMGMSMREFEDAVKRRTVNSAEFLKNFSKVLGEVYGPSAEAASTRLYADINRLFNTFYAFRQTVFNSGFEQGITRFLSSVQQFLETNPDLARALGEFTGDIFENLAGVIESLDSDSALNAINSMIGAIESLINTLRSAYQWIRRLFDEPFDNMMDGMESDVVEIQRLLNRRNNKIWQRDQFDGDNVVSRAISDRFSGQITQTERDIGFLLADFQRKWGSQMASEGLSLNIPINTTYRGIDVTDDPTLLPKAIMEGLNQFPKDVSLGTNPIELTRVDPNAGGSVMSIESSVPDMSSSGMPASLRSGYVLAKNFAELDVPDFWNQIDLKAKREDMEELVRLQHEMELAMEGQNRIRLEALKMEGELKAVLSEMSAIQLQGQTRDLTAEERNRLDTLAPQAEILVNSLQTLHESYWINEKALGELATEHGRAMKAEQTRIDQMVRERKKAIETYNEAMAVATTGFDDMMQEVNRGNALESIEDPLTRIMHDIELRVEEQESMMSRIQSLRQQVIDAGSIHPIDMTEDQLTRLSQMADALEELLSLYERNDDALRRSRGELDKYISSEEQDLERRRKSLEDAYSFGDALTESFTTVEEVFLSGIGSMEDALTDLAMTGKANFEDLTRTIIASLVKMSIQAFITNNIFRLLFEDAATSLGMRLGFGFSSTAQGAPTGHTGGIVGADIGRFHSGGVVGPKSGERMIMALDGEGVFTREQMRSLATVDSIEKAMTRSTDRYSDRAPPKMETNIHVPGTKVEIINQGGGPEPQVQTSRGPDGRELIRVFVAAVADDIARNGMVAKTMGAKYGLKPMVGDR